MMPVLLLFVEFFKIGLFAVGGGLATMPFLYALADQYNWFTTTQLIDMIAISESTPGPIGINMATFVGYQASGVLGAVVASLSMVLPSFFIIIAIARMLSRFKDSKYVKAAFYGLRPAVAALIFSAAWGIIKLSLLNVDTVVSNWTEFIHWKVLILFGILYFLLVRYKKHPVVYIGLAALIGMVIPL